MKADRPGEVEYLSDFTSVSGEAIKRRRTELGNNGNKSRCRGFEVEVAWIGGRCQQTIGNEGHEGLRGHLGRSEIAIWGQGPLAGRTVT